MANFTPIASLVGGIIIGLSATIMLLLHGRVTGITGILAGAVVSRTSGDWLWRALFLLGLVVGGALMVGLAPAGALSGSPRGMATVAAAGLLVGFGTRLGSGCTSGHGVCGVSRLSPRSLVATASFMLAGVGAVFAFRVFFGG